MTHGRMLALAALVAALVGTPLRGAAGSCELSQVDRRTATTARCMTCHDGSAGTAIGFQMAADGHGMSHPVGVDYRAAAAAHPAQYQPPGVLPAAIPLVGGKVTCTTCHDGASRDPKHVAAVKDLCLACHRL